MPNLPEAVSQAWDARDGAVVLTTVDAAGNPNSIYATCVSKFSEDKLVVADNYFDKTRKNILAGSRGSVLFITGEKKAYQVKGSIDYVTEGPIFDDMKHGWLKSTMPGHAAAVVNVEEVWKGAEKLL